MRLKKARGRKDWRLPLLALAIVALLAFFWQAVNVPGEGKKYWPAPAVSPKATAEAIPSVPAPQGVLISIAKGGSASLGDGSTVFFESATDCGKGGGGKATLVVTRYAQGLPVRSDSVVSLGSSFDLSLVESNYSLSVVGYNGLDFYLSKLSCNRGTLGEITRIDLAAHDKASA